MEITWSDRMGHRGRSSWLLLVKGNIVLAFEGKDIQAVVVVQGTDFTKEGKWSHTTYLLKLANGVRAIPGKNGWETGRVTEGIGAAAGVKTPDTWSELADALGVSVPSAMEFFRAWCPSEAEKLDAVERALENLALESESEEGTVTVTVSFGNPTRGQMATGFWESPKPVPGFEAEVRLIDPVKGWVEGNVTVVGISGTVMSVRRAAGMHGGYCDVTVAVIPGTETGIEPQTIGGAHEKSESAFALALQRALRS